MPWLTDLYLADAAWKVEHQEDSVGPHEECLLQERKETHLENPFDPSFCFVSPLETFRSCQMDLLFVSDLEKLLVKEAEMSS